MLRRISRQDRSGPRCRKVEQAWNLPHTLSLPAKEIFLVASISSTAATSNRILCHVQRFLVLKTFQYKSEMTHGRPAKRRRLTPPINDSKVSETIQSTDLFQRAADWDLEQDYETRARSKRVKENNKLPIKNVEGKIEHVHQAEESENDSDSFLDSANENEIDRDTPPTEDAEDIPTIPVKQQIVHAQEEVARLAELINEDPEENAGSFKKLGQIAGSDAHPSIQKLVLLSQAAIYRDTVPGYRIRAYKDEDLNNKVSKDIRRTRQYEHSLVTNYQAYVRNLVDICKGTEDDSDELKATALNCVCSLLLSIPHFNFRTELLEVLVRELRSRQRSPHFLKSLETVKTFFEADEDGQPALEAVTLLTKMMKAKDYDVKEDVLDTFLHLRLLTELSLKASTTQVERSGDVSRLYGKKVKKEKWEHRSKKEKKLAKERKAVEKDMKEADASVDYESREKLQSETLKIVFVTYFRILKVRMPHLIGAVLEGLAKFAHLINQDFFGDILEALKDIVRRAESAEEEAEDQDGSDSRDKQRECLLAVQAAFTLLSNQDTAKSASALHLDLSFFTSHIYRSLYAMSTNADIELGPKTIHLPDPHAIQSSRRENKVNVSTPVLLLTRALTSILLTPSQPPTTQSVAAFYKRLLTVILQVPEKSGLALLTLMNKVIDKHGRRLEPLWHSDERKGDGVFRMDAGTVEATNVFSVGSGIWESELLRQHYCPEVRERIKSIDKSILSLAK